jgi:hypothetical protein
LAVKILAGEFKEGDRVKVDSQRSELIFIHGTAAEEEMSEQRMLH